MYFNPICATMEAFLEQVEQEQALADFILP